MSYQYGAPAIAKLGWQTAFRNNSPLPNMAPPGAMAALTGYGQPKAPDPLWITTYSLTGLNDVNISGSTLNVG